MEPIEFVCKTVTREPIYWRHHVWQNRVAHCVPDCIKASPHTKSTFEKEKEKGKKETEKPEIERVRCV